MFNVTDEDDSTLVRHHRSTVVDAWLRSDHQGPWRSRSIAELHDVNLHKMTSAERRLLFDFWYTEMEEELHEKLRHALSSYNESKKQLDLIKSELDLRILRQASIIGITTTGLARNLELLRGVNSKVLLCEEAGEVLEAHLLTALLPSIEHCILIGDHQQLRPQV